MTRQSPLRRTLTLIDISSIKQQQAYGQQALSNEAQKGPAPGNWLRTWITEQMGRKDRDLTIVQTLKDRQHFHKFLEWKAELAAKEKTWFNKDVRN